MSGPASGTVPAAEATSSASGAAPAGDSAALAEEVDIDVDTRQRILEVHGKLARTDHYALLGVDRGVDKKVLKRAYYDLAAKFHPDRYFRKNLGSYKVRIEAIFSRVTLAHETLSDKAKRAEYDAYLEEQQRSRGIEDLLEDALAEIKRAQEKVEREARAEEKPGGALPPHASSVPSPSSARPPEVQIAARRDALARRLLGGRSSAPVAPAASSHPPVAKPPVIPTTGEAMDALRRRYQERVAGAKMAQARKYVANGEKALAAGDAVAAANAFRVAKSLAPSDPTIARMAEETQTRADEVLSDMYLKQALYEEKNGQWVEAARSWARVCKTREQDAVAHERAANAIVKAHGDLHQAGRLAQRACELEPKNAAFRLTLAEVYVRAELTLNARREIETAAQLAPHDVTIQAMLRRLDNPT